MTHKEEKSRPASDYYTHSELLAQGWTSYQIRKHLPRADHITWIGGYPATDSIRYFLRTRVEEINLIRLQTSRKSQPATEVDLLAAIFAVNRSAKRYRDSAQANYQQAKSHTTHGYRRRYSTKQGCFAFSTLAKDKKTTLYSFKDRGIVAAYKTDRINYGGQHGNMATYRGEGYVFHSGLVPVNVPDIERSRDGFILVEAKPKTSKEARLKDAEYTLSLLPTDKSGFKSFEAPTFERPQRQRYVPNYDDEICEDCDESYDTCRCAA